MLSRLSWEWQLQAIEPWCSQFKVTWSPGVRGGRDKERLGWFQLMLRVTTLLKLELKEQQGSTQEDCEAVSHGTVCWQIHVSRRNVLRVLTPTKLGAEGKRKLTWMLLLGPWVSGARSGCKALVVLRLCQHEGICQQVVWQDAMTHCKNKELVDRRLANLWHWWVGLAGNVARSYLGGRGK